MSKQVWKGGALLAPLPAALVTAGTPEASGVCTVAWTGIVNTKPPKTYISLRKSRYTYTLIEKTGEFVLHITTAAQARAVDYCGMYTGRKVDKFAKCGFTKTAGTQVVAPVIAECPLALECKVSSMQELGTHVLILADILATDADEAIIDGSGKLCLDRVRLLAFAHGEYFALGEKLGKFGFSAAKTKAPRAVGKAGAAAKAQGREKPRRGTGAAKQKKK
ncbi:MAG: flavin reductase family protein [Clostridia bacterium]|nr:flavin reductase family protein [Clostridia bacterium]